MAKSRLDSKYVVSTRYRHPQIGDVTVRVLSTAKRMTARWKSADCLVVTIPKGVTHSAYEKSLEALLPRILAVRPALPGYRPGWRYVTPETTFEVVEDDGMQFPEVARVDYDEAAGRLIFNVLPNISDEIQRQIDREVERMLNLYSRQFAAKIVLPRADFLAAKLGVKPTKISISYGQKVLGRCNSRGEVLLSRNIVFLPLELRDMVIAHEFAHLTHLNHSPAFYALLDRYLDGRLGELRAAFKAYRMPFLM